MSNPILSLGMPLSPSFPSSALLSFAPSLHRARMRRRRVPPALRLRQGPRLGAAAAVVQVVAAVVAVDKTVLAV
eukprot:1727954-Pyramimonas_sp.AAC.1